MGFYGVLAGLTGLGGKYMKMIRIAKIPYIKEDTDRWGIPLGTFSVVDVQGEIDEDKWTKIQEYEGYYISEGAKEDEAIMKAHIDNVVRVNGEAMELLTTGNITFPRPDASLLKEIKLGQIPYEQVAEMIEQGVADLHTARDNSVLRDTPDKEWVDNLVYEVYSEIVKKG